MAQQPILAANVKITAKDINGNNIQKIFNNVLQINVDYNRAVINIVDTTGSFQFAMRPLTTFTYTIVPGDALVMGSHSIVMS